MARTYTKKTAGPEFKYLVVENLTSGVVGFTHPDSSVTGVAIRPYEKLALPAEVWEDIPDIDKLVELKLIAITQSDKRPRNPSGVESILSGLKQEQRSAACAIAYTEENSPYKHTAYDLINLKPENTTPNPGGDNPDTDVSYLKTLHRQTLLTAIKLLELYKFPWSESRIAEIRERIDVIDAMRQ